MRWNREVEQVYFIFTVSSKSNHHSIRFRPLNPVPFTFVRHGVDNDDMEEEDVMVKNGRDH